MAVTLSDQARRYIALFEEETGATARDCVIDEADERVVFVVATGEMAAAIGPDGQTVQRLQDRVGMTVELVEDAPTAAGFVANALAPAAVYDVTVRENETTVAVAEVAESDTGVAIGRDGRNIEMARRLADRHFDVGDIQVESRERGGGGDG